MILARGALTPRDWGLYAVGGVAQAVLLSFNELGVSLAVVRWDRDPRSFAPTVVTLATASSTVLYVGLWFLAHDIAVMLGSPDATGVLRILCFAVVVDGVACVPNAVLMREFRQRARLTIDLLTFVVSSGLTLLLAFRGWGASSFAWGGVAGVMVALIGCGIAAPGYLRPGWDRDVARELVQYGAPLAGASLFVLATMNTDSAVVGATLGPVALGLYRVAFTMSSWPVRAISETARRVSFAGFSRAAVSAQTLTDGFTSGLSPLLIASVPACALLAALPGPIIRSVYGDPVDRRRGSLALSGDSGPAPDHLRALLRLHGRRRSLAGAVDGPGPLAGRADPRADLRRAPQRHQRCRRGAHRGRGRGHRARVPPDAARGRHPSAPHRGGDVATGPGRCASSWRSPSR